MMELKGPYHEFYCLSVTELQNDYFWMEERVEKPLKIADDIYSCLKDYFDWLDTMNPAKKESSTGLCRWGVTIIDCESANKLSSLVSSLMNLFKNSPDVFDLTGDWEFYEGESPNDGAYQKIRLSRDYIVERHSIVVQIAKLLIIRFFAFMTVLPHCDHNKKSVSHFKIIGFSRWRHKNSRHSINLVTVLASLM